MGGVLENILIRRSGVVLRDYVLSTFTYGVIVKKNNTVQYNNLTDHNDIEIS
jgi:hypothetical protein